MKKLLLLIALAALPAFGQFGNATRLQGNPICAPLTLTNGFAVVWNASTLCFETAAATAGSVAFSGITGDTNTSAAMVVGTGASMSVSGTGTNTSNRTTCPGGLQYLGADGTCISPPTNPTPGYSPNQCVAGCGVEWTSGLIFEVGASTYTIGGNTYSSSIDSITLDAADPSDPRIDVIGLDDSGNAFKLTGTAAANPSAPTVDPTTQVGLTLVYVAAGATSPTGVSLVSIYEEDTEWTSAVSGGTINANSSSNPYRGTKDIEATAAARGAYVTLTKPAAGTENLGSWNNLLFYIRSKAQWPTGNGGGNAARYLLVYWLNGSTPVGVPVILRDGQFGFNSATTGVYQQVSIPTSLFGTGSSLVTTLKIEVSGVNSGSTTIGWYIDGVSLQGGTGIVTPPGSINSAIRSIGATFGSFQSGASALADDLTACVPVNFAGTIQSVSLVGNVSGDAEVDVLTVPLASWTGTASTASITASATPALTADSLYSDSNLVGWSKNLAANTMVCFEMTSPATVAGVAISLKVQASN